MDEGIDDIFGEETLEMGDKMAEKSVEIVGEIDVLAPTERGDKGGVMRNERGQWIKGHAPPAPLRQRKPRAQEQALIAALHEALPADKVKELLDKALTWAQEYKSPKLILAVLQFHYSYTLGMPVQRSVTATTKLESILSQLGSMDDSEFSQVEEKMRGE